uniref:SH2 domain-containing protein n=2 Tax=Meloidogyne javanica TaxID=6303 RepID=A0A915N1Z9_MELJA
MLDSQNLKETIKQLQSSGILFCVEFVGSVIVEKSINSLSGDKQTQFARACMKFVINNVVSSIKIVEDDNLDFAKYLNLQVQSFKNDVELNISSSAFIIIDTTNMRPLHRFNIQDISLFSPGFEPPTPICNEQKFFDTNYLNANSEDNTIINLKLAPELPPRKSRHSLSTDVSGLIKVSKRGRSESNFADGSSFRLSMDRLQELTTDLSKQKWFHGLLTREESDSLLCENGQFFVRNSPSNPNRFVLVGMHNGKVVHIRLLNNEGKLQTTAGEFKNIVDFINYFYHSQLPVIVDEKSSLILLHFPINRR